MATTPKKTTDTKSAAKRKSTKTTKIKTERRVPKVLRPFVALGGYFKGAWFELRQVRWPDRKATWSLTGAVLLFTAFFVVLILLLDVLFKYLFQLILG